MEFSPFNKIVKICIQGMEKEDQGKMEEARKIFHHGWNKHQVTLKNFSQHIIYPDINNHLLAN